MDDWAKGIESTIAREIRRQRDRRNWTAAQLSDRVRELGHGSLTRQAVSKIETGARSLSIDELLALALAFEVPPVLLLFPLGMEAEAVVPGGNAPTWDAVRWFCGEALLDGGDVDDQPGAAPLTLFRRHQRHVDTVVVLMRLTRLIDYSGEQLAPSALLPGLGYGGGWTPEYRERSEEALAQLVEVRKSMRQHGLIPPALPPELERLEGA